MTGVTELGYIGIGVSDGDAWKAYASQVVGLEVLDEGLPDRFFLREDTWHHRIAVHLSGEDDLLYLGWRVAGQTELEDMKARLSAAGIEFREGSRAEAEERHVLGLLKLTDPGGIATEIFHGPEVALYKPFHPGRPMHGRFRTGGGGAGHLLVRQPDSAAAYKFYRVLGLEGGVEVKLDPPEAKVPTEFNFVHCNDRQHSLAWISPQVGMRKLGHLMLEYEDVNDLGIAHDIVEKRQIPIANALGIHSNDRLLSFYSICPSGWLMELGASVGLLTATQSEYSRTDIFGHRVDDVALFLNGQQ